MKIVFSLIFLAACSSTPDKKAPEPELVSNEVFKKEKPLANAQVADFYRGNSAAVNPALQDETLDRHTPEELSKIDTSLDPLVEISLRCSRGEFKEAFDLAAKAFQRYQKVAPYWNQVANCHLNSGSHRKALLFYNKALEVSPDYVPALNNIGVMYSRQGQDQKALVAFERASKAGKFTKTPRYNLAKLYLSYGLAESALPLFQSLLNTSPQDVDLLNAVGSSYFLMSDYQRAWNYYQKIPQSEWSKAEVGLNIALTLKKLGRKDDAEKVFKTISEPGSGRLKQYYASVEAQLGEA